MWFKYTLLFLLISFFAGDFVLAQEGSAKKDSTHLYKNIETYSKRSKFNRFIYSLIFKPTADKPVKRKRYKKLIVKPYSTFEGKTIRNINIETLDPFGFSIGDSIAASPNFLSRTANSLHVKSQPITIRNLLLIRQNQIFDSLLVKESERLVRSMDYIRDVSFYVKTTAPNSDSVDIYIRALDIWSINPKGTASASGITVDLTDQNFLGLGHNFQNVYTRDYVKRNNSFITNYSIPNIRNTYISTTLHYDILGDENFSRSLTFDRPFFSPFAKWAAGVNFSQQFRQDSVLAGNSLFVPQRIRFNLQDYWAGEAIKLFKGNSEYNRTTNFITAIRFFRLRYLERPTELLDTINRFSNENFYLASIGISTRRYVQDKYIFKFGITEDVPIGKVISLTGGYQIRNTDERLYLGARISFGNYNSWGYLAYNLEFGTFFKASDPQQGIVTAGINYFTGLLEIGKWKFRQFVKPQVTIGINRFSYDSLTINQEYGLNGFNSPGLSGTKRLLLTLQTQSYAPWNFIGFRFGPFLTCSLGMLGDVPNGFNNSKLYMQIGMGVLIKNENLVFNAFQLSIAFYPSIPGMGQNVLKTNSFQTNDFGFKDFEIGKPGIVVFQ
jgi:hypothetical protein